MDPFEKAARMACFANCNLDGRFCRCKTPRDCVMWDRMPMQEAGRRLVEATNILTDEDQK